MSARSFGQGGLAAVLFVSLSSHGTTPRPWWCQLVLALIVAMVVVLAFDDPPAAERSARDQVRR